MKIKTYEQRILTPDKNKWLYNEKAQSISNKVYLGINADINEWVEITDEEAKKLQEEMDKETE